MQEEIHEETRPPFTRPLPLLQDLSLQGKNVFMRADFNVPLKGQNIQDPGRIDRSLPSIRHILKGGGRLIIGSHLGRPRIKSGKAAKEDRRALSLEGAALYLSEKCGFEVTFIENPPAGALRLLARGLKGNKLLLLENLRFCPEEEREDQEFARKLASAADVYINESFSCSHRKAASITAMPLLLEERAAGFLFQKEEEGLQKLLNPAKRPFYAILGGGKIKDKIPLLKSLLKRADGLFIGGAAALVFLKARGEGIGSSYAEKGLLSQAGEIMEQAAALKKKLFLPIDHIVEAEGQTKVCSQVLDGYKAMDIGPQTVRLFLKELEGAGTVFWNGPLGLFEKPKFRKGTEAVAAALAKLSKAYRVAGGGHTALALKGLQDKMDYVSTAGGAALMYLERGSLPGLKALCPQKSEGGKA